MYKKYYKVDNLEKEDSELIDNIVSKSRNGFFIWPQWEYIADDGEYSDCIIFKFGDACKSSNNLTKEINDALLKEVKKEFKEIKEYYEINELDG